MKIFIHFLKILNLLLIALFTFTVCSRQTAKIPKVKSIPAKNSKLLWVKSNNGLRMRGKPSLSGKKIALISGGEKVVFLNSVGKTIVIAGAKGKWCKVKWQGKTGWLFGGFLTDLGRSKRKSMPMFSGMNLKPYIQLWSFLDQRYSIPPQTPLLKFLLANLKSLGKYKISVKQNTISYPLLQSLKKHLTRIGVKEVDKVRSYPFGDNGNILVIDSSINKYGKTFQSSYVLLKKNKKYNDVIAFPVYAYKQPVKITLEQIVATPFGQAALLNFSGRARAWMTITDGQPHLLFVYIQGKDVVL